MLHGDEHGGAVRREARPAQLAPTGNPEEQAGEAARVACGLQRIEPVGVLRP